MRESGVLLFALLAACGGAGDELAGRNEVRPQVQTADITGLYEGSGEAWKGSRLCIVPEAGRATFGLVVETARGSCSGAGDAVRSGGVIRLAMTGDQPCAIEAATEGRLVRFPAEVPESCAYYCAPGTTMAGASFEKTGGSAGDAVRAVDLAGDPLCG